MSSTATVSLAKGEGSFILRRLHSLSGVIPLGVFLLFHFFENASARRGAEAFNQAVEKISSLPYIYVIEICGLLGPLVFHAVYGLFIRTPSRQNVINYSYWRNWAYFFQRFSGLVAFAFIFYHVWTTRVWALFVKGEHITYLDMQQKLSEPWVFWFYVLGVVAVTYHFANGIWSFCVTWGIVTKKTAQDRLALLTMLVFVALCIVGIDIAATFRYGQGFLWFLG